MGALAPGISLHATTWREVSAPCPVDGTEVRASIASSTYIPGTTPDFNPMGVGVDMVISSLLHCPTCRFTAPYDRFVDPEGLDGNRVQSALREMRTSRLFAELDAALVVERNWTREPERIAHYTLAAKWLADATGEPEGAGERLQSAIRAHLELWETAKDSQEGAVGVAYLLGELNRQIGEYEEAIRWFDRARANDDGTFSSLIEEQSLLARLGSEDDWRRMIEEAKTSPEEARPAILPAVLEIEAPEAVRFVEDLFLHSSEPVKQAVAERLFREIDPRSHHRAMYLEGLGDSNFRTVQASAHAVASLGISESLSAIQGALKEGQERVEFALLRALAAVATEESIDFIVGLEGRFPSEFWILAPLIRTKSPEALPHIERLLDQNPRLARHFAPREGDSLKSLGRDRAFLAGLPDLISAREADPLAILKVHVLGKIADSEALDRLAEVVTRDDDIGFYAAYNLLWHGNHRARERIVGEIDRFRTVDSDAHKMLFPMLNPEDYHPIRIAMNEDADRFAERVRFMEQYVEESTNISDEERSRERERLERMRWFVDPWLRFLGATGHELAVPVLLEYLDDDSAQNRAAAAFGLGFISEPSISGSLIRRLHEEEETFVREGIVRALGAHSPGDAVPALVELLEEPTLYSTKIAWMEAMTRLDPVAALPYMEEWAQSPHPQLSRAAEEALSGIR